MAALPLFRHLDSVARKGDPSETSNRNTAFPVDVSPDKTCQNKPVPFWQVLEADGEGNLVAAAAGRSAPAMGLGDGSHHG